MVLRSDKPTWQYVDPLRVFPLWRHGELSEVHVTIKPEPLDPDYWLQKELADTQTERDELRAEVERLRVDNSQLVARAYAMQEVVNAARGCMESGPGPGNWPRFDALRRAIEALSQS